MKFQQKNLDAQGRVVSSTFFGTGMDDCSGNQVAIRMTQRVRRVRGDAAGAAASAGSTGGQRIL